MSDEEPYVYVGPDGFTVELPPISELMTALETNPGAARALRRLLEHLADLPDDTDNEGEEQ